VPSYGTIPELPHVEIRVRREAQRRRDLARRDAVRPHLDKQSVDIEAIILRQGGQGGDGM
jgi:hypothetical protein